MSNQLADVTAKLSQTTSELNATKAALADAENVVIKIGEIANEPAKRSIKDIIVGCVSNATKGLRMTNELGSECGRLCENVSKIKGFIG